MKNILVATDLTERSDRAMDRAAILAKQLGASLHIVYIVDDEVSTVIAMAVEKNATTELRRQVTDAPLFKDVKSHIHVEFGDPWRKTVELAEELDADLVVLGVHRNRGVRELFRGTTLHRIAKSCRVPMLVVVERALGIYHNVMVGVDFSECARNATVLAASIADRYPLTLVHAYHIPFKGLITQGAMGGDISMREKRRIEAEIAPQMEAFVASLPTPIVDPRVEVVEGGPVAVLRTLAQSQKVDLVCVGSHAKPWLLETLLGSTAFEVLSYPPCDVLIAPLTPAATGQGDYGAGSNDDKDQ